MDFLLGWSCSASLFPRFSRGSFFSVLPERFVIFALCTPNQPNPSQSSWNAGSELCQPLQGLQGRHRAALGMVELCSALCRGQWGQCGTQDTSAALPGLFSFGEGTGRLQPLREEIKPRSAH